MDEKQATQIALTFGKALQEAGSDTAMHIFRDILGVDPEVYEYNPQEIIKACMQKIGAMEPQEVNNLLAKMAIAGGKKPSQIVSALFMARAAEEKAMVACIIEDDSEGVQE